MMASIFMIVLLIGILLIVLNFKVWAIRRDAFYTKKLVELENRIISIEQQYAGNLTTILEENKKLLKDIKQRFANKKAG